MATTIIKSGLNDNQADVTAAHELKVSVTSVSPSVASNVNIFASDNSSILLGQKTMALSLPVTLASDQTALSVTQSTSPWVISGNVNAAQSGVWTTGRTWTLLNTTDSVNIGNFPSSFSVTQGTSPWLVSGSTTVSGTVTANQGTSPWLIAGTGGVGVAPVNNPVTIAAVDNNGLKQYLATKTLGTQVVSTDFGIVTNSVIHGLTTGGGGGYVDVKVNPSGALSVDGSGVTQPISAVSLPLPTGASTSANQTNGSQKTQIVDGSGNVIGSANNSLDVATPSLTGTGTITANGQEVDILNNGYDCAFITFTGTWSGTVQLEAFDGTNWNSYFGYVNGGGKVTQLTVNSNVFMPFGGASKLRLRASAWTSGTLTITYSAGIGIQYLQVVSTTASAFNAQVVGTVASASADSGNPVKAGSKYNATLPSFTDGNRADLQANKFGELAARSRNKYTNITGNATTVVKSGAGVLACILWGFTNANQVVTIYDNTAGSGTIIATISPSSTGLIGTVASLDLEFSTGLTVVTSGLASGNITIGYQ